jgi:hypothetical protein
MKYHNSRALLLVTCVLLLSACEAVGSDAVTQISQQTLTGYALATGVQSGSLTFPVTVWGVKLVCNPVTIDGRTFIICHWTLTQIVLWYQTVTWAVVSPAFNVTPLGVMFTGKLVVTGPGLSVPTQPFSIPATVNYNSALSSLALTVSSNLVTVPVTVSAGTYDVGVNLSPYYSISVPLQPATFNIAGRNLTGGLQNVSIQYSSGSVVVANDFWIQ